MLNGVQKPADAIARGPHRFDEATRKYVEIQPTFSEYPRAMWHATEGEGLAESKAQQVHMEANGWQAKPFPAKPVAKETVTAPAADLALIVLDQQRVMRQMQEKLEQLEASQPTTAPAIPEVPRRMGRPPVYPLTMVSAEGQREVHSKAERDTLEAKGWKLKEE
jgi:hypothetical protein